MLSTENMCNMRLNNIFIVCVEVAETDKDLLGTGLQRPRMKPVLEIEEPQPSGQNVPIPESFSHRRTELDTEVLMEIPDTVDEPESALASDLACMNYFKILYLYNLKPIPKFIFHFIHPSN